MLFVTKLSSFTNFLVLIWFGFLKCFGAIEEDKFTFLKTISMNEEGNVYRKFYVPYKRNHILTCSAKCVTQVGCIGIDICDGRICRLWNLTFSPSLSSNNSNEVCQRYIKVSMLSEIPEFTSIVLDTSSNQTPTSPTNDQSLITERTNQVMASETDTLSSVVASTIEISTVSVAIVDSSSSNDHTTVMLSYLNQTKTITPEKSGLTDSITTTVMTAKTSSHTDSTITDVFTKETPSFTDKTTTDAMTTETSSLTASTTIDVMKTETTSLTASTTTDVITTETSSLTDSTTTDVMKTETSSLTDSTTTDVRKTETSSLTASTTTDVMPTETSSLTDSTTTHVMTTETSNATDSTATNAITTETSSFSDSITTDTSTTKTSGPIDSTTTDAMIITEPSSPIESTTSNALLTETTTKFQTTTEAPTTIDSTITTAPTSQIVSLIDTSISDVQTTAFPSTPIDSTTIMITTESSDKTCIMTHEFSGGIFRDVPCYNDTYSWIVIQRRYDGSVDFYRNWNDYKLGFGSINSEFWLGNSYIHELTSVFGYAYLRIEIKTFDGQEGYAEYAFSIDDEALQYMIHITWISGNISDSLWLTDGALFCTLDRDNDGSRAKVCTTDYHGGWWYTWDAWCTEANLNGFYYPTYKPEMTGIFWFHLDGYFTLKEVRMMIRKP